ncbi:peroxiredoxin family protein [Sporosarcina koreensis]|uniref:peroxiredoxin family protein n=1 Tax=Sporosarcina koreensis TaxID=334735 RepID=UPI00058E0C18|nr:TlpA disulfide reductase family protein [Sporosarcina koreensis]
MKTKPLAGWLLAAAVIVPLIVSLSMKSPQEDEYPSGMIEDQPETASGPIENTGLSNQQTAPDFTLETLSGESVKLSDYRGKKVFLNFWASWCGPCRTEMPAMQEFYTSQPGNADVEILAVNMTKNEQTSGSVKEFVKTHGLTFPVLLDTEGTVERTYKVVGFPTTYLIAEDGRIAGSLKGAVRDAEEISAIIQGMD